MKMVEVAQPVKRRSRRSARSAEPGQNPHLEVPFILRRIPPVDLLDDESLARIADQTVEPKE